MKQETEYETGLLPRLVHKTGLRHGDVHGMQCKHGCHGCGLVNDGNTDLDCARCRICPETPLKCCDYCSGHAVPLPTANEYQGQECLINIRMQGDKRQQTAGTGLAGNHIRVKGVVGAYVPSRIGSDSIAAAEIGEDDNDDGDEDD